MVGDVIVTVAVVRPMNRHVNRFGFYNFVRQRQRVTVAGQLNRARRNRQHRIAQRNCASKFCIVELKRDARHGIIFNREIREPFQRETRGVNFCHVGNFRAGSAVKAAGFAVRRVNQITAVFRPNGVSVRVLRDGVIENETVAAVDRNFFRADVRRTERNCFSGRVN